MKLSIIIVSYNEKEYLSEAIDSCLNQKISCKYEIIIGDDGSSDGSVELIDDYVQKYPNLISSFVMDRNDAIDIPSLRVSNVLKKAFERAEGDYITILSGDDLNIGHTRLGKQIDYLEEHSDYKSCYINYKKFWMDGREKAYLIRASTNGSIFWGSRYAHISCFVFRRECLMNLLDRFCDDTGLLFSIIKTGKSKHINILGFGYRQREKSIMHEADLLELYIIELMLFQDCLNGGGMTKSSMSRYLQPLKYVYKHRTELTREKYRKYLENCKNYSNDILEKMVNAIYNPVDRKQILALIRDASIYRIIFVLLRKMDVAINILIRNIE